MLFKNFANAVAHHIISANLTFQFETTHDLPKKLM